MTNTFKSERNYRTDIDGLRAIAVISVVLFHLGYLHNGYLGVDVFFVISGYLITGIVFNEVSENKFSVLKFYERRIRRILPLVLLTTFVAFLTGLLVMLPNDLENLCQSVIASNLSLNNILMYITSNDYWAVKNDYKPLLHTWSLGVEEQFYLLYPLLFLFLKGSRARFIFPVLILFTAVSFILFFMTGDEGSKFYLLRYRFYELSLGGICAIYFGRNNILSTLKKSEYLLFLSLLILVCILYFDVINSNDIKIVIVSVLSCGILVLGSLHFRNNLLYRKLLSNKAITWIGKISFSLYMWHQIVFAFARYFLIEQITFQYAIILMLITLVLSILSYYYIENVFRNRRIVKTKSLLIMVASAFLIVTASSFYVYSSGGVIKDVPELGITKSGMPDGLNLLDQNSNYHIEYNEDIRKLNVPFTTTDKIKILVIGDSFGRDFSNILLESSFGKNVELSYFDDIINHADIQERLDKADYIFYTTKSTSWKGKVMKRFKSFRLDYNKFWVFGTKDFGKTNGIYYNRKDKADCSVHTIMKDEVLQNNEKLKLQWGERYIDILHLITDSNGRVLVFTPDCKFISQDTVHLTEFGAIYFAKLLDTKLKGIIKPV